MSVCIFFEYIKIHIWEEDLNHTFSVYLKCQALTCNHAWIYMTWGNKMKSFQMGTCEVRNRWVVANRKASHSVWRFWSEYLYWRLLHVFIDWLRDTCQIPERTSVLRIFSSVETKRLLRWTMENVGKSHWRIYSYKWMNETIVYIHEHRAVISMHVLNNS